MEYFSPELCLKLEKLGVICDSNMRRVKGPNGPVLEMMVDGHEGEANLLASHYQVRPMYSIPGILKKDALIKVFGVDWHKHLHKIADLYAEDGLTPVRVYLEDYLSKKEI